MKLCIECKYHVWNEDDKSHYCHYNLPIIDPVDGKQYYLSCYGERQNPSGCGIDGRSFQSKPQNF